MLEYCKVYTRWIPQKFTQKQKEHHRQVCHDLLNQYENEADSFLDHIITSDEMWGHHYEPRVKTIHGVAMCDLTIEGKVRDSALSG